MNEYKTTCDCKPRDVEVVVRKANYSAFNGYRRTPSDYSEVRCRKCGTYWRTKAKYVDSAPESTGGRAMLEDTIDQKYNEWIAANVEDDGYGQCAEATLAMAKAFPELTRVRGHYCCLVWGMREHWWLEDLEGNVVDPTARQFPTSGGVYVPWNEGDPEPTGKCPNCGDYCYDGKFLCSDECEREYIAYCNSGW